MLSIKPHDGRLTPDSTSLSPSKPQRRLYVLWLSILVVALSFGWFFLDGNVGINLADEGFLWYGSQALKAGLVPIRDFQAYDPGRYLWIASWSYILGDGVVALRAACVILQCFGILAGSLAARRVSKDWKFLLLITLILTLWMSPRYKVFEQSISLVAIYVAVLLIENPTLRCHFFAGVFVGLMAFVGRNHGLYLFCSFGMVLVLLAWSRRWENLWKPALTWGTGISIGYLPQLFMFVCTPGYFDAYLAVLRYDLSIGTNIALPVPWPWTVPPALFKHRETTMLIVNYFAEGSLYLLSAVFIPVTLLRLLRMPRAILGEHALFAAAACVFLTYAHHSFSRADYVHLAHSVPALTLGVIGFVSTLGRRFRDLLITSVTFALSILTTASVYPHTNSYLEVHGPPIGFMDYQIAGEKMRITRYSELLLTAAKRISEDLADPGDSIMFLPHLPGLFAATERLSPTKQIYFMLPASPTEEAEILAQMHAKKVRWVLLQDIRLDNRDDLRFARTNPLMTRYFAQDFRQVVLPGLPTNTVLLRLKE